MKSEWKVSPNLEFHNLNIGTLYFTLYQGGSKVSKTGVYAWVKINDYNLYKKEYPIGVSIEEVKVLFPQETRDFLQSLVNTITSLLNCVSD